MNIKKNEKEKINNAIKEIDSFILKETGIDLQFLAEQKEIRNKALSSVFNGLASNTNRKKFGDKILFTKSFKIIQ